MMAKRKGRTITLSSSGQGMLELDSPLKGGPSNEHNIMVYPFFDLDRKATREHLTFQSGTTRVEVKALSGQGVATIYDRDLIIYAASLVKQQLDTEPGVEPKRELVFSAHDFFAKACRDRSMRAYEKFEQMVDRLKGTMVKTNVETGGRGVSGWFNWLGDGTAIVYDINEASGERRMLYVKLVLCEWLVRAIKHDKKMFAVPTSYFDLPPIARRLYDLARVNCDGGKVWETTLGKLHAAVGSNVPVARFKVQVNQVTKDGGIPEFDVTITDRYVPLLPTVGAKTGGRRSVADQIVLLSPGGTVEAAVEAPEVVEIPDEAKMEIRPTKPRRTRKASKVQLDEEIIAPKLDL
ncbi:replication initiator protein A [Azospirillum sp. SYSU D00513]|uniref:replication initiator protein A n=1 Tax=Azospirillum sp. SYSU D00513 TaxID=2812561 RepID=UPI001A976EA1|nr:replication initiator protein A [Azospirillum sp. SYSU D00513]